MIATGELQLTLKSKDKTQTEKMIALLNLGIVDALESGRIDVAEAIRSFYGEFELKQLKIFRPEIERIVGAGLELLDLRDIYPEKYEQLWKEQYQLLRKYSEQILKNEQPN